MRIGLMHGDDGSRTVSEVVSAVVADERDGFEAAWFGQVFGADSLTLLALAGRETSRIAFGTAVIPTYTRHPFAMAQQALTVQAACGGRLTLGIGPSHLPVVEAMWGMSYDRPARHVREYLAALIPLVRDGRVAFNGELFRVNAGVRVKDAAPLPVMISALAPAMLQLAGSVADGTITWMTGVRALQEHIVPRISAAARAAGRPAPRVAVGLPICVTDDASGARETAAKLFVVYGQLPNYRRILDREGAAGPADVAIIGNELEVERHIRALAAAGATDLFGPVFPHGGSASGSVQRTRELLRSLVGKVQAA
jgi:5,10-methylenetetrahydromethanopterin reductase